MMRFILDCLRPARARAAAAAREPVELQVQEKGTEDDNEIKELKDELNMEEENLQKVKVLCHETRKTMENLEEKKTQLRDQLKIIHDLHKQEKYMLQSLQGEQRELQQTLEQYKMELRAASDDLLHLQVEVTCAKTRAEIMHEYIAPLQDSFKEIEQVKQKLDELIAGLMTDNIIEMTEEAAGEVLEQESIRNTDVEIITSNQKSEEVGHVERESTAEKLDKMQCSAENLSSGSSSFTEITLTEVKEEDVMFRSNTPQLDSSDMEEEDLEIVQASLATHRKFNFFHPNPFTDGDVFGDDHFPKVDVTGLPRDPFKGTDPFASDTAFVDISEEKRCQDGFITAENSLPETIHCPLQSVGKDKDYGTFNAPFNMPFGADFKQPPGELDHCVSMLTESRSLKSFRDACPKVGTNPTQGQNLDSVQPDVSKEGASSWPDKDGVHESGSSHSSTSFNSFDVDCNTFAGVEDEEDRVRVQAGFSFTGRDVSLCGLQSIIAGSYTGFPLSPCDPKPFPGIGDTEKAFEHQNGISSEQNDVNDKDCYQSELGNAESCSLDLGFNSPDSPCEELHDVNGDACNLTSICDSQPSPLDAYDYKYGDMFFFTVRLDPGSPEIHNPSPVCSEPNDLKNCQSLSQLPWKENPLSLEFNDTDEFKCCAPKPEYTKQHSLITDDQKGFYKMELINKEANSPPPKQNEKLRSDSETGNSHACQNMLHSENDDEWKANLGVVEHDPFSPVAAGSAECISEFEEIYTVYSFSYDAPRLDSGYHEAGTPTRFSSEPTDPSKCCIDLKGPCLETIKQSNSKIHVPDPFSLESVDTGIFGSETENCESGYMIARCQPFIPQMAYTYLSNPDEKQMSFINTESCDVLSDHFNGSELGDCDSFSSFPHNIESHDVYSSEENVIAGSIQNGSATNGETIPSSMVSNPNSSSQVIHCGSVRRTSEMSHSYPEVFDSVKVSKNSMIHVVFESEFDHFGPNINKQAEEAKHLKVNITKMADLAEIDSFCSELSKMVSSHSSDSVQLSVAEMLFGSDPNTSRFYPWDFEKQQHSC
ncbi:uncharacterized protein si:ch73-140j24.4 isoform X2 [Myxocyprinus asiaticus]|uniref:uncharacterized protein si:ch73-140j24.4 isoform X2 n=1 Tax=Myxocyprinus asiaticus TaxID=70543 RepID=UPI0022225F6B|nr:uncharacterized protein si:ch73-140j24.4 isoform X2 [Myxocyprinus asiaticus]